MTHRASGRGQNSSRFTEAADILLIHDRSARAITMVGRAGCDAEFVDDYREGRSAWAVVLRHVVEIEPISFKDFCAYAGEKFRLLRGQSGKFIRPDLAQKLLQHARPVFPNVEPAFWPPRLAPRVGLPDPERGVLTIGDISDIDGSLLRVEEEVEYYTLEPLLRVVTQGVGGCTFKRRMETGTGVADYAIILAGQPVCVVEAKRRVATPRAGWNTSKEFQQARRYCHDLEATSFMLADRSQFLCFTPGCTEPVLRVQRSDLTRSHISLFRDVVFGARSSRRRRS